ncbi:MAG: helix-turn-helix transcriptional regulator [Burkholderiales bacterium]|nr:helix-turn-helix transcriptional regulator [Burkholderiales bacterium]
MDHEAVRAAAAKGDAHLGVAAGLGLLLDELAHGVLILGPDARVLHANHAARQELARRHLPAVGHRLLEALRAQEGQALQDVLHRGMLGKRSLVTLALGEGPALPLAVVPLKADGPGRGVALVFSRAAVCDSLMLCFFARCHGLTPTEELVLGILCQGCSAPEVAARLEVAVSTVRSHVRSLCAKTRSSGVRELVKRVSLLPPVAPPLWHEPVH